MSETDIKNEILDYCKRAGIWAQRRHLGAYIVGNRRVKGKSHQADLWGILKGSGRHWEYELKKPGEEPTEDQLAWLADCQALGAYTGWGASLDQFIDFMADARAE